jgi:hypothetical protein
MSSEILASFWGAWGVGGVLAFKLRVSNILLLSRAPPPALFGFIFRYGLEVFAQDWA